ncbi:hypothetical protein BDY24DRAFT_386399 [Mrakia frigida]|uniref:uncharacterized protein n=1 Tax=Mrakia frigida TaxID=29902 RepID=UPI003FCC25ED
MSSDLSSAERSQLKRWLVEELAPISDADTDILADYVLALLKADAPEPELEKELHEQLTDFLEDHTPKFVASFLATLRSKSYVVDFPLLPDSSTETNNNNNNGADILLPGSPPPPTHSVQLSDSTALLAASNSSSSSQLDAPPPPSQDRPFKRSRSDSPSSSSLLLPSTKSSRISSPTPSASASTVPVVDQAQQQQRLPCFDYHQRGYCPRGVECMYEHDLPPGQQLPPMAGMGLMQQGGQGFQRGGFGGRGGGMWERGGRGGPGGGGGFNRGGAMMGGGGFGGPGGPGFGGFDPSQQPFFDPSQFMDPSFSMLQPNGLPFPGGPPGGGIVYPPRNNNNFGPRGGRGGGFGQNNNNMNGGGRGGFNNNNQNSRNNHPTDASRKPPKERNTLTLVVSSIPPAHLNLPSINDHFSKFGTVTNIAIDARSARALVSFETNEQAYKAWRSEEVIFGSRFVTILWHAPLAGHGAKGQEALEKSKEEVEALRIAEGGAPRMSKEEVAKRQRKIEGQVAKQKVLMGRLANTTTVEGKKELMEQLRVLTAEMEPSLAPDLLVGVGSNSNSSSSSPKPSTSGEPLSQEEEERQRLDRELTEGRMEGVEESGEKGEGSSSNTAMLLAMLAQKKAEAALLGLDPSASSSSTPSTYIPRGRGRGRGAPRGASTYVPRGRGGAAFGAAPGRGSMKLDLRTKSLAVVGEGLVGDQDARKAVESWYEGGGQVDSIRVDEPENRMVVTFKSRGGAEQALARGNNILDLTHSVALSWFNAPPTMVAPPKPAAPADGDEDDSMGRR